MGQLDLFTLIPLRPRGESLDCGYAMALYRHEVMNRCILRYRQLINWCFENSIDLLMIDRPTDRPMLTMLLHPITCGDSWARGPLQSLSLAALFTKYRFLARHPSYPVCLFFPVGFSGVESRLWHRAKPLRNVSYLSKVMCHPSQATS